LATWSLTAQLTTGTLSVSSTDRVWWNAAAFGDNVTVNNYQDSTHITDNTDTHLCTTYHVNNTKYLTGTTLSLNGGSSSNVSAITQSEVGLVFNFSDVSANATSGAIFYAYDGTTDINPMSGVTFQAFEGGVDSAWTAANGSGSGLGLANQSAATSHNFYIATSVSPTSNGEKTGSIKIVLTYT